MNWLIRKFTDPLYFFQLENYHSSRFFKTAWRESLSFDGNRRQSLDWTPKATLLFSSALALIIIDSFILYVLIVWLLTAPSLVGFLAVFIIILISPWTFFLYLIAAKWLLAPLDYYLKQSLIKKAKRRLLGELSHLKIVAITGSYGKTTMKEIIFSVLSQKLKVAKTPENINTPLGIARFILNDLTPDLDVFVVEMGAYQKGDIRNLCSLAKPNVSVLTGINESHLERFGSLQNTIAAKFEIIDFLAKDGLAVLNADDKHIVNNYASHIKSKQISFYSAKPSSLSKFQPRDISFDTNSLKTTFTLTDNVSRAIGPLQISLLGEYIIGTISGAAIVADSFYLSDTEIQAGLNRLKPIPHRLEPRYNSDKNVLIIDDSYNGNPAGVREAIKVLSHFKDRRKIYVTPGLVETGPAAADLHGEIGHSLSSVVDIVILIKTSVSHYIKNNLLQHGFPEKNILEIPSLTEIETHLNGLLQPGDVILFQNDWPDNYR